MGTTARRGAGSLAGLVLVAAVLAGCTPALSDPAVTDQITLVSTSTLNGWRYDFYRNAAYPCSISGFQTFTVGTRIGSSATATAPLWVFLHGGGTGYFDASGTPRPNTQQMTEEAPGGQRSGITNTGLSARIRSDAAGFRMLAVSYCNRDLYSGALQPDPNNPNLLPDGSARTTNGLLATKAAIQYVRDHYPTGPTFLHGGSAGSAGAYTVAWALQLQGIPPAGVVGDASVVNLEAGAAAYEQGACRNGGYAPDALPILSARVHPDLANIDNEPDKLVARGALTVPLVHMWNIADPQTCGATPMVCPLRDGSTTTLGTSDCTHRPLADAIAAEGPGSRSLNMRLCVDDPNRPGDCDRHVVTGDGSLRNSDPAWPADFLTPIMDWVHARLADG
jgi:hypothetical protein